jgi:hypothetical protein
MTKPAIKGPAKAQIRYRSAIMLDMAKVIAALTTVISRLTASTSPFIFGSEQDMQRHRLWHCRTLQIGLKVEQV